MARVQTLVQLNDELLALLDERALLAGVSRSELIRRAIELFVAADAEAAVDAAIVAGYTRSPANDPDTRTVGQASASIDAEPW